MPPSRSRRLASLSRSEAESRYLAHRLSRFDLLFADFLQNNSEFSRQEFEALMKSVDISQKDLACILDIDVRTVNRWANGKNRIPRFVKLLLTAMDNLSDGFFDLVKAPKKHYVLQTLDEESITVTSFERETSDAPQQFAPEDIRQLEEFLNLTDKGLAQKIGVSPSTIHRWKTGKCRVVKATAPLAALWRSLPARGGWLG